MEVENPKEMKVLKLRDELKSRNLSPSGLKSVLVKRLLQAYKAEGFNVDAFMGDDSDGGNDETPSYIGYWRNIKSVNNQSDRISCEGIHIPEQNCFWSIPSNVCIQYSKDQHEFTSFQKLTNTTSDIQVRRIRNFSVNLIGDVIVLFGGQTDQFHNDIYIASKDTKQWRRVNSSGNLPTARCCHSATVISDKEIVIIGGLAQNEQNRIVTLNDIHVLNIETWTWSEVTYEGKLTRRAGHSATLIKHEDQAKIFLFGGFSTSENGIIDWNDSFWRSDASLYDFENKLVCNAKMRGCVPQARAFHSAIVKGDRLYVFGGSNKNYGTWQPVNYVDYLDVETLKWTKLNAEGELPNFRQLPANYFEPLWISIDLPHAEMMFFSPYNQYEDMNVESEDEAADYENEVQLFKILNAEYKPDIGVEDSTFEYDMKQFFMSEMLSDINFRVQNKYLRAHKSLVSSRSDPLRDLCNKKKKRGQTITVEGVKYVDFRNLLKLLYTGKVIVRSEERYKNLRDLLKKYPLEFKDKKLYKEDGHVIRIPTNTFNSLYNDKHSSDIRLLINGKSFFCHKWVLAARSGFFNDLFSEDPEASAEMHEWSAPKETDSELFSIVLQFIYLGPDAVESLNKILLKRNRRVVEYLLTLAGTYRVLDLKLRCEKALLDFLDASSLVSIFGLAIKARAHRLKAYCRFYLSMKWQDYSNNPEYRQLFVEHKEEMDLLIKQASHKKYYADDEYPAPYFPVAKYSLCEPLQSSAEVAPQQPSILNSFAASLPSINHVDAMVLPNMAKPSAGQYFSTVAVPHWTADQIYTPQMPYMAPPPGYGAHYPYLPAPYGAYMPSPNQPPPHPPPNNSVNYQPSNFHMWQPNNRNQ